MKPTMPKILFLTTSHRYDDDRIFYHQAKALKSAGYEVKISSLCSDFKGEIEGIVIESYSALDFPNSRKIKILNTIATDFAPDCIICSEPLAVVAAKNLKNAKTSITYDITEWYPSKRMVAIYPFPLNILHSIKFFLIQIYAGFISSSFIFGEKTKKFPLATFFPFKKSLLLPYFPDEKFIFPNVKRLQNKEIKLCYTGIFSKEKGIENFFDAADFLIKKRSDIKVSLLIIGSPRVHEKQYFDDLLRKYRFQNLEIRGKVPFEKFSEAYSDADICFDLREKNFENDRCLPIKLFYYLASGKPVVFSNLNAIGQHMEISGFLNLVHPENAEGIAKIVENYVDDPEKYFADASNARKEYEKKYNWELIKSSFLDFVNKSVK